MIVLILSTTLCPDWHCELSIRICVTDAELSSIFHHTHKFMESKYDCEIQNCLPIPILHPTSDPGDRIWSSQTSNISCFSSVWLESDRESRRQSPMELIIWPKCQSQPTNVDETIICSWKTIPPPNVIVAASRKTRNSDRA